MTAARDRRASGFTLLEVVIALVVLEVAVVGAVGVLVVASQTLAAAERLERAVALSEGALDSLALVVAPTDGAVRHPAGEVRWRIGSDGEVILVASGPAGDTLFQFGSVLPSGGRP